MNRYRSKKIVNIKKYQTVTKLLVFIFTLVCFQLFKIFLNKMENLNDLTFAIIHNVVGKFLFECFSIQKIIGFKHISEMVNGKLCLHYDRKIFFKLVFKERGDVRLSYKCYRRSLSKLLNYFPSIVR